jgi:hypothetical protein
LCPHGDIFGKKVTIIRVSCPYSHTFRENGNE